jgi:2-haloacid dehalogenase
MAGRHIVFDVNETLLDVAALDPLFERLFGDARVRSEWFLSLEESWLTATIIGRYRPFGELAKGALAMIGRARGLDVPPADQNELVGRIMELPPHADVVEALQLLLDNGFRLATLSNGTGEAVRHQMAAAHLTGYFEDIISADDIQRYKPAPEPYRMAAERLGITTGEMLMVAAHAWDIAGAAAAGCRTAFVARPGKAMNPAGPQPDLQGEGLLAVVRQIVGRGTG